MKKLLYGTLFLALVGITFTFTSCKKSSIIEEQNQAEFRRTKIIYDLSFINPSEMGYLHNVFLEKAIKKHYSNPSLSPKEVMTSLEIGLTIDEKKEIFCLICNTSINEKDDIIRKSFTNRKSDDYFNLIGNEIVNLKTYPIFSRRLDHLSSLINATIIGNDKYVLLTYLETSRNSAFFWLFKELGGSGIGNKYFIDNNRDVEPRKISDRHKEILREDGLGAGIGMVGWGLSGAWGGPIGGLAGFVFGAVYGGVTSSLIEGGKDGWGGSKGCC